MKKFSLQFFLLLLLFAGAFFLASSLLSRAGGGVRVNNEEEPPARYAIQVVLKARANPPDFWRIVEMGTEMAAKEFEVAWEVAGPQTENDIEGQMELVRAAIAKKPDALVLAAGDYERLAPLVEEAVRAGIRVVVLDSDVDSDAKACFVGTDNYELGQKLGALVEERLQSGERFGVVAHVETSFTAIERKRGLLDSIENADRRMAGFAYCDGSMELARQQAIEMLEQNPDITCMVGLNESSALGICFALEELRLAGKIKLIACDSSEAMIKYMENGTIQAFVIQNPFNMGYLSLQAAVQVLEGKRVEPFINTGSVTVTKEDMYRPENQKLLFPFTDG